MYDLKVGTKVVICHPVFAQGDRYILGEVIKETNTQSTIRLNEGGEMKFNKRNLVRIGDGESWNKTRIMKNGFGNLMTWDEINETLKAQRNKEEKLKIIRNIMHLSTQSNLLELSVQELETIQKILIENKRGD